MQRRRRRYRVLYSRKPITSHTTMRLVGFVAVQRPTCVSVLPPHDYCLPSSTAGSAATPSTGVLLFYTLHSLYQNRAWSRIEYCWPSNSSEKSVLPELSWIRVCKTLFMIAEKFNKLNVYSCRRVTDPFKKMEAFGEGTRRLTCQMTVVNSFRDVHCKI